MDIMQKLDNYISSKNSNQSNVVNEAVKFDVETSDGYYYIFIWTIGNKHFAMYCSSDNIVVGSIGTTDIDDEENSMLGPANKSEIKKSARFIGEGLARYIEKQNGLYGDFKFDFGKIQ